MPMKGKNPNGFDKDPERARRAGRKSRRGKDLRTMLRDFSEKKITKKDDKELAGYTYEEAILLNLVKNAKDGDIQYVKEYFDRLYGKAIQQIDNTSSDGSMTPQVIINGKGV